MTDVPHFALPLRYVNGAPVVNEQDSLDDVAACVAAILRTRQGERDTLPEFGSPDLTFAQQPLDMDALLDVVGEQEPRARLAVEADIDDFDTALARVEVDVTTED